MTREQLKTRPMAKADRGYRVIGPRAEALILFPYWITDLRLTGFSVINDEECDLFEGYIEGGRIRLAQPISITRSPQ